MNERPETSDSAFQRPETSDSAFQRPETSDLAFPNKQPTTLYLMKESRAIQVGWLRLRKKKISSRKKKTRFDHAIDQEKKQVVSFFLL